MYEDDDEVSLRIRVWDIGVADWDRISAGGTVPDCDAPESRMNPFQLSNHGSELASEVTGPPGRASINATWTRSPETFAGSRTVAILPSV
ncbi:hypothetical protein SAMN06265355_10738 [Actinomadura mexicana]|uniref:Uncharacterized protein n=1 Tax=Actinomadura mexicana TaxID=134959 RepID=A0A238Z9M6_9ACTN|nr:hypothetical protein SAMN06265355_10738 [Actinomadura mexicana]